MSQSNSSVDYLVTNFSQFKDICEQAGAEPFVAIDTEFMRQNTYFADLCLVQIGYADKAYCIDVFEIDDLSPLTNLLTDASTIKVFHSCRQDFEVLYQRLGVMPAPLFDTQLAAAFCGYDAQAGYARVVLDELGIELDKSQTRTDWTRRPLSEAQIIYAADDVVHLSTIYKILRDRLEQNGRITWFEEETESFYNVDDYEIPPAKAYKRLNGSSLSVKAQHYLAALSEWRESKAQTSNIPRTWVLKDKELYDVVGLSATSTSDLANSDIGQLKTVKRHTQKLVELCQQVENSDYSQRVWDFFTPFDGDDKQVVKSMLVKVGEVAEQIGLAQSLLATRKDVESLVRGSSDTRINKGWRSRQLAPHLKEFL